MAIASPPQTALDKIVRATQDRLAVLGQRRAEGMNTLDWRLGVQAVLKDAHIASAALSRGGFENLTKSDLGFIGSRLRAQYDYLAVLGLDTKPGEFGGQAMARLAQYGNGAVRGTASALTRRENVDGEELNVLGGGSASCDECASLADQGWVPAGTLPEIGERTCAGNCNCAIETRAAAGEAA